MFINDVSSFLAINATILVLQWDTICPYSYIRGTELLIDQDLSVVCSYYKRTLIRSSYLQESLDR